MFIYKCQDLDGLSFFHLDHIKKSQGGLYSYLMDTLTSKFPLSDCFIQILPKVQTICSKTLLQNFRVFECKTWG